MTKILKLNDRCTITIEGDDAAKFLQGLITNDIKKVNSSSLIYTFMLSPQGRFLYDFFITSLSNEFIIDCQKSYLSEILQKFNYYKLRSKIKITDSSENYNIYYSDENIDENSFIDSRCKNLGYRTIISKNYDNTIISDDYHYSRINELIPDGNYDLIYNKSFVLEFDGLKNNAIDLKKGCYVGQEVTSRMHYRGNIRRKIYLLEFQGISPTKGEELIIENKKIGIYLGNIKNLCLCLLNMDEVNMLSDREKYIHTESRTIRIIK